MPARRLILLLAALLLAAALAPGAHASEAENRVGAFLSAAGTHTGADSPKTPSTHRPTTTPSAGIATGCCVAAKGPRSSFEALSKSAADDLNDEGLSVAGRALQKHGGRPGGSLPTPTGNPTAISRQAQQIVESVLQHPNRTRTMFFNKRLGEDVVDIRIPGGVGVRYTREEGRFVGFLEPRR